MNGVLGHLCAHLGWTGPGEPPEDDEMNKMTRYLSTKEAPYNIESLRANGEETFWLFDICRPELGLNSRSSTFQAGSFSHCTRVSVMKINIFKPFVQCWPNVEDAGPTLYKCYANVLCLLRRRQFQFRKHKTYRASIQDIYMIYGTPASKVSYVSASVSIFKTVARKLCVFHVTINNRY